MNHTTRRLAIMFGAALGILSHGVFAQTPQPPKNREPAMTSTAALDQCSEAVAEQPRTAIEGCLRNQLKAAGKRMDSAYADVRNELEGIDSNSTDTALNALKDSQDAFEAFRAQECKRQGAALMGGTGAGDVEHACQVALTHWREAQLRQR